MKGSLWAKRVVALTVIALLLIGGTFAETQTDTETLLDELEQARARIAELEAELSGYKDPSVVARFDGGVVRFEDVMEEYQSIVELYKLFYDVDLNEDAETGLNVQADIVTDLTREAIIRNKLEAMGVVLLSDEQLAQAREEAEQAWNDIINENIGYYEEEGKSEEETYAEVLDFLEYIGYTHDSLVEEYISAAENEAILHAVAGEVSVNEEQVTDKYRQLIEADKEAYGANPDDFEYAMLYGDGVLITWVPEGFRLIRQILIPFSDEQLNRYDELSYSLYLTEDEAQLAGINAKIDALYAEIMPAAQAAIDKLKGGEAFASVMEACNDQATVVFGALTKDGSCVHAESVYYDEPIVGAAMALSKPGDYSEPVKGYYGLYIIEYTRELTPGEVPLADIYDQVYEEALASALDEAYNQKVETWMREANIEYYLDRLN